MGVCHPLLAVLCLLPLIHAQWDNGYFFNGRESFAELPSTALCDNFHIRMEIVPRSSDGLLFVAYNSRLKTMILLQTSKPFFNLTLVDMRRKQVRRRQLSSIITLPYMFSDWLALHEIEIQKTSPTTMRFRVDRMSRTVHLHGTASPFPMEEIRATRFFLSRPHKKDLSRDDHWIFSKMMPQSYRGYFRNLVGPRDCDCAQTRRLNLVASQGLNISKLEPCELRNPCDVGCLCISYAYDPTCHCNDKVKCPEFSPFKHKLPMDDMLGQKLTNQAGLTARASGVVQMDQRHAVSGKAIRMQLPGSEVRIREPPDAHSCFSHLSKCEKGVSFLMWIRLENPTLHKPNDILRHGTTSVCSYGLTMTHSITEGLHVSYKNQAGFSYVMNTKNLQPERWIHVIVQVPDTSVPYLELYIDGQLQRDPNAVRLNSTLRLGLMIKCRSNVIILGNPKAAPTLGLDGIHSLMIDNLEVTSPMLSKSFLRKLDLSHYIMTSVGKQGQVFQLTSYNPRNSVYKFITKGVAKAKEIAREESVILSPVTDGVLTLPKVPNSNICLFDFNSCLNGLYLSVWIKIGAQTRSARDVRLILWNEMQIRLKRGKPSVALQIDRGYWTITNVSATLPIAEWVFLEASWDRHYGLQLFLDRVSVGTAHHKFNKKTSANATKKETTLILGANVEFQIDEFHIRTAGRQDLIQMEKVSLDDPQKLVLSFDKLDKSGLANGKIVGKTVKLVPALINKGIQFNTLSARSYIDLGANFNHMCLGNINHCPNGIYISFWLLKTEFKGARRSSLLTTGYNGISVFWRDNNHILVVARTSLYQWVVRLDKFITSGRYHFVEISWDLRLGLRVFCDLRLTGSDILPRTRPYTKRNFYRQSDDRIILGFWTRPFPINGSLVIDELGIWAANREFLSNWKHVPLPNYFPFPHAIQKKEMTMKTARDKPATRKKSKSKMKRKRVNNKSRKGFINGNAFNSLKVNIPAAVPEIDYPQFAIVPLEWASSDGRIPNTRLKIRLQGEAKIVRRGKVGSAVSLNAASRDFVSLGEHFGCYGNIDSCTSGLTIRFWMFPKTLKTGRKRQVVLAARSYVIFMGSRRTLFLIFKGDGKTWISKQYEVKPRWQFVEVSWSRAQGLRLYVDGNKVDIVANGVKSNRKPLFDHPQIYIGRPPLFKLRLTYSDLMMDELQFFQAPLDFMEKHDVIPPFQLRYFPLNGVQKNRLYFNQSVIVRGDPKKVSGVGDLALQFPGTLEFGSGSLCLDDDLARCPLGFTLRMWVKMVSESATIVRAGEAVKVDIKDKNLHSEVWSHGMLWKAKTTEELPMERWCLVEVSWERDEGLFLFVDGKRKASVYSATLDPLRRREMRGLVVGDSKNSIVIDELKIWNAKINVVLSKKQINRREDEYNAFMSMPQSDAGHEGQIDYLKFSGDNYLRYNFSGSPPGREQISHLIIEFSTSAKRGVLWLSRQKSAVNILYIHHGRIYLRIMHMEKSGEVVTHRFNIRKGGLADGKRHSVELLKNKLRDRLNREYEQTTLSVDKNIHKDKVVISTRNKVNLRPRDLVYLGGLPDAAAFGLSFLKGNIYKARVEFNWGRSIDFLIDIRKFKHRSSNGPKVYVLKKPDERPKVLTPTPNPNPEFDPNKVHKDLRHVIIGKKVAYTFFTSQSRLYLPSWTTPMMKSIEFEISTYEPRGLLFFIGAGIHGRAYVAIEIFDSLIYSVYSDGEHSVRTLLSPHPVNDGHNHRLLAIVNKDSINVTFNNKNVPIPRIKNAKPFEFDSYTYVAGVDVFSLDNNRLPWDVWSRSGFIGCILYIQINGYGYFDAREYQDQHSTANRNIGTCTRPRVQFCDHPSDCGHGICYRRWFGWRSKENFFCDCTTTGFTYAQQTYPSMMSHEVRGQKCTKPSTVFKSQGKSGRRVIFSPKLFITHTDHITMEFKVTKAKMGFFESYLPSANSYLKAYMWAGRAYVSTNIFKDPLRAPNSETYEVGRRVYNDGKWHTMTFIRRANYTSFWMDKESPIVQTKLPYAPRSYYFEAKEIKFGLFNDPKKMPPFIGEMRNFYWNAYDFFSYPRQVETYDTKRIDPPKKKTLFPLEPPMMKIITPVTIKYGTNYIFVFNKFFYDRKNGASIEVVFRTREKNALIFYLHGGKSFIIFQLVNGRPSYSYDIGTGKFSPFLPTEWKNLNDQSWHQVFMSVSHEEDGRKHAIWLDGKKQEIGKLPSIPKPLSVFLGGLPGNSRIRRSTDIVVMKGSSKFNGCFGEVALNGASSLNESSVSVSPVDKSTVLFGKCIDPKYCNAGYCKNGGKCINEDWDRIACNCTTELYEGKYCEKEKPRPDCPKNYCKNGVCVMKYRPPGNVNKTGWHPECECGTEFFGKFCENENRCPDQYCSNHGVCSLKNKMPYCNCTRTAYSGPRCRQKSPGVLFPYDKPGYIILPVKPPYTRNLDDIAFGFQTWMLNGSIMTFETRDGTAWSLFMREGYLYLGIGDKREYRIAGPLNDGNYHVVSMIRVGGSMDISLNGKFIRSAIFSDIATGSAAALQYSRAIVAASSTFSNFFKGSIGGFHWNGHYYFKGMSVRRTRGTVNITVTPLMLPRPVEKNCPADMCKNCGRCYRDRKSVKCNCDQTGYGGFFCEKRVHFGIWSRALSPGSALISIKTSKAAFNSQLRFAFQTFSKSGPLICLVGRNGKFWKFYLKGGYPVLSVNGKDEFFNVGSSPKPLNDAKLHVINVFRRGSTYIAQVGGCGKRTSHYSDAATVLNQFEVMNIHVGADCTSKTKFNGVVGAIHWNGYYMTHAGGDFYAYVKPMGRIQIVKLPFALVREYYGGGSGGGMSGGSVGGSGGIPNKGGKLIGTQIGKAKEKPLLIGLPTSSGGYGGISSTPIVLGAVLAFLLFIGALLWACIFCKPGCIPGCCCGCCACFPGVGGEKQLKLSAPFSHFQANGTESHPLIKTNGFQAPPPMGDLPMKSAGDFESAPPPTAPVPPPLQDIGKEKMSEFQSAPPPDDDDIPQVDRTTLDKRKDMTLTKNQHLTSVDESDVHNIHSDVHNIHHVHHIHHWTPDGAGMGMGMTIHDGAVYNEDDASYRSLNQSNTQIHNAALRHNERLDLGLEHIHGAATSHAESLDGDHHLTEENVFTSELRVNCCHLTRNSKYAVTGSSGAPEVWDLESGSLIKVMDGSGFGCTGLHLACKDEMLVGQIHDDSSSLVPCLQAWDFSSGRLIDMGRDLTCTAICVTHLGHHAIIARLENEHDQIFSIVVWDLMNNKQIYETFFMPSPGLSLESGITFLKVSFDDRFVVAGYSNNFDNQANYIVFDLTLAYAPGTVVNPHVIVFDAMVDCTEILPNNEEAITGTHLGELIVWDLHSGRSIRHVVLKGYHADTLTALPAHNGSIQAMAISTDGQILVTAAGDHLIRSWTLDTEELQHTMKGHTSDILSVAISEDKELVVSGSDDGSIRVWRLDRNGNQLCWFTSNIAVFHVKLSSNKEVLVALGERSEVRKLIMLRIVRNKARRKHLLSNPVV